MLTRGVGQHRERKRGGGGCLREFFFMMHGSSKAKRRDNKFTSCVNKKLIKLMINSNYIKMLT